MTFGERVKLRLFEMHRSQMWLAKETETSYTHISMLCSGKYEPRAYYICRIADALNVSTDWLLGRTEARI